MSEQNPNLCPLGSQKCPIYTDIEQLHLELSRLRQEVVRDPLTGLYNRRHFNDLLLTELERSRRSMLPTSLVLLDIDHFKLINDRYGHVEGDNVLQQLARKLESTLRIIDIPCRYGGEEFAIILPATPLATACLVAERLRVAVAAIEASPPANAEASESTFLCTASLGVSTYHHTQTADPTALIERADKQLYEAKRLGRNRVAHEKLDQPSTQLSDAEKAALAEQHSRT